MQKSPCVWPWIWRDLTPISLLYVRDGTGAAQDHGLDFVQFVNSDGTLISSAQYPSRVGHKNDWVLANKSWRDSRAFLNKEEIPDGVALSLTVVRTLPVGDKNFYIIGRRRLDQNFLASLVLPAGMRTLLYQNLEPGFDLRHSLMRMARRRTSGALPLAYRAKSKAAAEDR